MLAMPKIRLSIFKARWLPVLCGALLLSGCKTSEFSAFFPSGPVADYERDLMFITFGLMLFVFIPVVVLTLFFAWRYRASNTKAKYTPDWSHSNLLEVFLWGGPIVIIAILGVLTWYSTYHLDPYKPLPTAKTNQTLKVDVIGMDWKWLFVYPQYHVASVNELAVPVNTPVSMRLTSDTVMLSFMIPQLGSQIFAMSGMQTRLNLEASKKGTFSGKNYQYNGPGFAKEKFHVLATSKQDFQAWIQKAKASGDDLNTERYAELSQPSQMHGVKFFSPVKPHLFDYVIGLYNSGKPRNQLTKQLTRIVTR